MMASTLGVQRPASASLVREPVFEQVHPRLLDTEQDLDALADDLAAAVSEAEDAEQEMRLHYALWLLGQARDAVGSIEALLRAEYSGVRKGDT